MSELDRKTSRANKGLSGEAFVDIRSQMTARPKVIVVMPAYNAARTLERTYADLPKDVVDSVILVDDASSDETAGIAQRIGLKVVIHIQNQGYGGNQKTCYIEALKDGADIVVMLHPDYQYDSTLVPQLIQPIIEGSADLVLGSRFLGGQPLAGGMPVYKYISNRFLTAVENLVLRQRLSECHTGFRAFSRRALETIPFLLNSNNFLFDTQVIAQVVASGFKIQEIGVPTRYFKEASSVGFKNSVVYGLGTVMEMTRYLLDRMGVRRLPRYRRTLREVASSYYHTSLFRADVSGGTGPSSPGETLKRPPRHTGAAS